MIFNVLITFVLTKLLLSEFKSLKSKKKKNDFNACSKSDVEIYDALQSLDFKHKQLIF